MNNTVQLATAPAWLRVSRRVARTLPAGRIRFMNWVCRRTIAPFWWHTAPEIGSMAFLCDPRDSIAREVYLTGRYEAQETALLSAMLKPGMTVLDVGANWGYFSLLAAHHTGPTGTILSLEPDPRLFQLLRANLERNQLATVSALEIAAGQRAETIELAGFDENGGNWGLSRFTSAAASRKDHFTVTCQPLDTLLDERKLDAVDVVKMDIEGAEYGALLGMSRGIAEQRYRRILLEVHPAFLAELGQSVAQLFELLSGAGYRGWKIDHSPRSSRSAIYHGTVDVRALLSPVAAGDSVDGWPHYLWLSPAVASPLP